MVLISGTHGLTIDNSPNSDLAASGDTGPLLEIRLLEEGGSGICVDAVAGRSRFSYHIWMNASLNHIPGQED